MKTQTRILDYRLYYTRNIELYRKSKKSRTVRITPILICPLAAKSLVLITVRRVHYGDMGKAPTTVRQVFFPTMIIISLLTSPYRWSGCHIWSSFHLLPQYSAMLEKNFIKLLDGFVILLNEHYELKQLDRTYQQVCRELYGWFFSLLPVPEIWSPNISISAINEDLWTSVISYSGDMSR